MAIAKPIDLLAKYISSTTEDNMDMDIEVQEPYHLLMVCVCVCIFGLCACFNPLGFEYDGQVMYFLTLLGLCML